MEVGGWVEVSLGICLFVGKSSQNSPKPVLIFWSSIPCVFCRYVAKSCWLLCFECSVHVSDGFPNKKFGWGWVGGVSSIQVFFWILLKKFNFAKLLRARTLRTVDKNHNPPTPKHKTYAQLHSFLSSGGNFNHHTPELPSPTEST